MMLSYVVVEFIDEVNCGTSGLMVSLFNSEYASEMRPFLERVSKSRVLEIETQMRARCRL
jgi:hypothetical protein